MASSIAIRKLVAGAGTVLVIALSLLTMNTIPLRGVAGKIISVIGATALYIAVTLAVAIHESYPEKHDLPEDFKELLTSGPYELCRHPFYLFIMITQLSIPLALLSIWGLATSIALTPLWLYLIKIEEKELIAYWREKYLEYMKKTPTLIPRLRRKKRS